MLRPSRRQGHERISQHEGSRTADSAVDTDGQNARDADEQDTQEPQNGESLDVDEENDLVLQANDNSEEVQENAIQISNNAAIGSERDLQLRRQSMCTMLMLFFLVRLWIEAIIEKDVGLIFLSLMGTLWTYRWLATRREEDELFEQEQRAQQVGVASNEGTGADAAVNFDPDLGLMSFQAQLALAILESQRSMFENGGYGGNDNGEDGPGVTEEARQKWKSYEWGANEEETANLAKRMSSNDLKPLRRAESDYGSVSTVISEEEDDDLEKPSKIEGGLMSFDDEPSCSICLCEYEKSEKIVALPCGHIFHEGCINSWVESHTKCPLCCCDLMDGFEQPASVRQRQQNAEEQRQFRTLALSTLGRRIRTRRSTRAHARNNRTLVATTEDSIV